MLFKMALLTAILAANRASGEEVSGACKYTARSVTIRNVAQQQEYLYASDLVKAVKDDRDRIINITNPHVFTRGKKTEEILTETINPFSSPFSWREECHQNCFCTYSQNERYLAAGEQIDHDQGRLQRPAVTVRRNSSSAYPPAAFWLKVKKVTSSAPLYRKVTVYELLNDHYKPEKLTSSYPPVDGAGRKVFTEDKREKEHVYMQQWLIEGEILST